MSKYQLLTSKHEHEVVFTELNGIEPSNINNEISNGLINTCEATMDIEDTLEIPLLDNSNSEYHRSTDEDGKFLCNQPGFGADPHGKSTQEAKFKIRCAIALCCIFMIIEFIGGYLSGSLAIMSDAAHLASDCITFVIGLVALWLGEKPPDGKMSFGYKRFEVIGAVASILCIWGLTISLVLVAIERIYSYDFAIEADSMMIISGIGIFINIVMIYILHGPSFSSHGHSHGHGHCHSHNHNLQDQSFNNEYMQTSFPALTDNFPKHTENGKIVSKKNLNLRAAMLHVIGDLVQSVGVFLASVLIKFQPNAKIADPFCTIIFSIIVILTTVRLFKESIYIFLDAVPSHICFDELKSDLMHIEGVKNVHHLNVWNHTSSHSVLMVHLIIDFMTDSNIVLEKARKLAASPKYNIEHCTIQVERSTS